MKKIIALLIVSANILILTACQSDDNMISEDLVDYDSYSHKTGSYTTTSESYGYTDTSSGLSNVSTTYLTYIADENGIIQKIDIDEVETSIYFDGEGQLSNYVAGEVLTKKELGDNYGMREASPIGKEWYEQIDALEEYMVGKNITTFLSSPNAKARTSYNNYSSNNTDYYSNYADTQPYGYDASYTEGYIYPDTSRSITPSENYALEITEDNSSQADTNSVVEIDDSMAQSNSQSDSMDTMDNNEYTNSMENDSLNPNKDSWKTDLTASVTIDTTNIMNALQNAYESTK